MKKPPNPTTTDPQQELLDVVNQQDQVVGCQARGEIHRLGLRHRACHMLVFNTRGQIFLQKRSMSKDNSPGLWDSSAAGHVDTGESYNECAVRELREELGLEVSFGDLSSEFKLEACELTGMEFAEVFTIITDAEMTLDPVEVADGCWLDADDLSAWISDAPQELTPVVREIWQHLSA